VYSFEVLLALMTFAWLDGCAANRAIAIRCPDGTKRPLTTAVDVSESPQGGLYVAALSHYGCAVPTGPYSIDVIGRGGRRMGTISYAPAERVWQFVNRAGESGSTFVVVEQSQESGD